MLSNAYFLLPWDLSCRSGELLRYPLTFWLFFCIFFLSQSQPLSVVARCRIEWEKWKEQFTDAQNANRNDTCTNTRLGEKKGFFSRVWSFKTKLLATLSSCNFLESLRRSLAVFLQSKFAVLSVDKSLLFNQTPTSLLTSLPMPSRIANVM